MSKETQSRTATRRATTPLGSRARLILTSGVVVAVIAILFFIVSNTVPAVAQERLDLDPVFGNPDAPVTIIEYGAYGCHACRQAHQAELIEQIIEEYDGQVNFIYRDFPIRNPPYDNMAANVAQCALDQGNDPFWQFHDLLFTIATPDNSQDELIELGAQAGLDVDALRACTQARTHRATVTYDLERAQELSLPGTPSFLINDQRVFEASPDIFRRAIEAELNS